MKQKHDRILNDNLIKIPLCLLNRQKKILFNQMRAYKFKYIYILAIELDYLFYLIKRTNEQS